MYIRKLLGSLAENKKFIFFLAIFVILHAIVSFVFLQQRTYSDTRNRMGALLDRIQNDLRLENGKWDMTNYNSDPFTPYPHGSSGFSQPLYIITRDGFVIERNNPINGFLNSSDFKHLMAFQKIETIDSITNENWRVISKPIIYKNKTVGVIFVSLYNPEVIGQNDTDNKLKQNLEIISSRLTVNNDDIDVSKLDIRNVHYDVSFEVVDAFNRVLLNNGRIPTFIDTSYVADIIRGREEFVVSEKNTHTSYLVKTRLVKDSTGNTEGVVVLGESLREINGFLKSYLIFASIVNLFVLLPLLIATIKVTHKNRILSKSDKTPTKKPKKIDFLKKESMLMIDDIRLAIPYASNQYYLCEALFGSPNKRWEQDELLERFGEEAEGENWRKVYDAMLAVNKKATIKLFIYKDKIYRFNPEYAPFLV